MHIVIAIICCLIGFFGYPFIALGLLIISGVAHLVTGLNYVLEKLESLSTSNKRRAEIIESSLSSLQKGVSDTQASLSSLHSEVSSLKPKQVKSDLKPRRIYLSAHNNL
jgi:hypothetical protein